MSSSFERPLAVVTTLFIIGARLSFPSFISDQVACKRLSKNSRILAAKFGKHPLPVDGHGQRGLLVPDHLQHLVLERGVDFHMHDFLEHVVAELIVG